MSETHLWRLNFTEEITWSIRLICKTQSLESWAQPYYCLPPLQRCNQKQYCFIHFQHFKEKWKPTGAIKALNSFSTAILKGHPCLKIPNLISMLFKQQAPFCILLLGIQLLLLTKYLSFQRWLSHTYFTLLKGPPTLLSKAIGFISTSKIILSVYLM